MRFVIESHEPLTQNVYHMRLSGDTRAIVRPGQFVQVQLPGFYLRRPISVCDWRPGEEGTLDLIYKVVGSGHRGHEPLCGGHGTGPFDRPWQRL